jgi:uncharacterized protein (DUF697 family)
MEVSQSQKIITETTGKIAGLSAIPIPFVDVAAMTYFQYDMVHKLADLYEVEVNDSTNLIISSLISSLVSKLASTGVEQLASKTKLDKMLQDSLIRASISGFLTTIIGEVYEMHFKNGGTLEDITLKTFATYFEKQFKSERWNFSSLTSDFMNAIDEQFSPRKSEAKTFSLSA